MIWVLLGLFGLFGVGMLTRRTAATSAGAQPSTGATRTSVSATATRVRTPYSKAPTAGTVVGRPDKTEPSAGSVVGRPDKGSGTTGSVAGRTEEPAPSAGTVAGRTDEPASSSPSVVGRPADTANVRSYAPVIAKQMESRVASPTSRLLERAAKANVVAIGVRTSTSESDCPGGVGAVLNYGSLFQVFFADWMRKHHHMGPDWSIDYNEATWLYSGSEFNQLEWEIETSPESQRDLWFHRWKEPPPPCKNLNSDIWNGWPSDSRGPLYAPESTGLSRLAGRDYWQEWGLWRLEDAAAMIWAAEQPEIGWQAIFESYQYDAEHRWADWIESGGKVFNRTWFMQSPWVTEDYPGRFRWFQPTQAKNLATAPMQLAVRNWNRDVMAKGRWKDRFLLRDTSSLIDANPYTFAPQGDDLQGRLTSLKNLENYLHNGRWLVWATLVYWLAYHKGDSTRIPSWWVDHCSAWGVPVPRPGRNARSVSVEGQLLVDPAHVPEHFHGGNNLGNLLRTIEYHTPIPGSIPVKKILNPNKRHLCRWSSVDTGSYRPPYEWPLGWLDYQYQQQPAGTPWAEIIFNFAWSVATSIMGGSAIEGAAAELAAASEKLIADLPSFAVEALSTLTSRLISAAGTATRAFLVEGRGPSSWEPVKYLEILGQATGGELLNTARELGYTSFTSADEAYNAFRSEFDGFIENADEKWGFVADLFGDSYDDGLIEANDATRELYRQSKKKGLL